MNGPATTGDQPLRILVVGTGLIGTSVGLAATARGHQVWLSDRDREHVREAEAIGAGRRLPEEWIPFDLVVVAVPPSAAAGVIAEALRAYPDTTVTDVSSVKAPVIAELARRRADLRRFVGGHPMAGRETSGPGAANAELFHGRTWLLTPTREAEPDRVELVAQLAASTGAAVREMPAQLHDRAVALTSHAPQVVSSLMAARLADADSQTVAVAGQGLRDVVRIAGSDPDLWADILCTNAQEVAAVLHALRHDLDGIVGALDGANGEATVARLIAAGNRGSEMLPGKHGGGVAPDYVDVPVEVPDAPGELGRLFLAAGRHGVNLEDVRIEHTDGRLTAIAHLYVLPEVESSLREALAAGAWLVLQ
ncbi:MAG: prephenate dehydrogenase [Actinobacteria bacterium]|nr:prephenate dehydrogenase [Actinomycetota bacterium]MCB9412921.1 prephenate dehydrogenase [Actinomycetota bacterium]